MVSATGTAGTKVPRERRVRLSGSLFFSPAAYSCDFQPWSATCRCLAAAFAHLGPDAEAREAAAHVLEFEPAFTISAWIARGGQSNAKFLIFGKQGCPNGRAQLVPDEAIELPRLTRFGLRKGVCQSPHCKFMYSQVTLWSGVPEAVVHR